MAKWKQALRAILPFKLYFFLKRRLEETLSSLSNESLDSLAKIYKTDKGWAHGYPPIYEKWLHGYRRKPIRMLEIGVGGYAKTHFGGNSLRMWKRYFSKGIITGIDIHDKKEFAEKRIHIYQGDQAEAEFLKKVNQEQGPFDIILDDGSHQQAHILASYQTLFPLLKPGGIYIIEDTQTAYWPKYQGSTQLMKTIPSSMNHIIDRIHHVNRSEWIKEDVPADLVVDPIESIAFYHNLIFVVKSR